jgi:hypothetical protein
VLWTDYSVEERMVKQQMAEAVLELLLEDTVETFTGIYQRREERSCQ